MKKIMGIDYGDARTGVAISDLMCTIVGSTAVVPSRNTEKAIADNDYKDVAYFEPFYLKEFIAGTPKKLL